MQLSSIAVVVLLDLHQSSYHFRPLPQSLLQNSLVLQPPCIPVLMNFVPHCIFFFHPSNWAKFVEKSVLNASRMLLKGSPCLAHQFSQIPMFCCCAIFLPFSNVGMNSAPLDDKSLEYCLTSNQFKTLPLTCLLCTLDFMILFVTAI